MHSYSEDVIPFFDFSEAKLLTPQQRIDDSIALTRKLTEEFAEFSSEPTVPDKGASPSELDELNSTLGSKLPIEMQYFLSQCRYLLLDDGVNLGGLDHEGIYPAESVWISDQHLPNRQFLVIGAYHRFADGDQLLIDIEDVEGPVIAYLHNHGPLFERFAPSYSYAIWRLVHEIYS